MLTEDVRNARPSQNRPHQIATVLIPKATQTTPHPPPPETEVTADQQGRAPKVVDARAL